MQITRTTKRFRLILDVAKSGVWKASVRNGSRWQFIALLQKNFSGNELRASTTPLPWYTLRHRMPFTGFTCHPVDAPAHDCNHNYVARNRYATSFHISRDNWLCSGFLQRFHITTLDPEHSGFTQLLSEAFRYPEHPPDKGVSSEEGRASDDAGLREGVHGKMDQAIALPRAQDAGRCTMPPRIIVASEDGSLKSPSEHRVSLLSSNITW